MGVTFRIGDFFAPGRIMRLRREFQRTQYMPPDALRAWQNERLTRVVLHAVRHVPYWRDLFRERGLTAADVRTVDDLEKLPLLTRETVRREGRRLRSNAPRSRLTVVSSSGSTGRPITMAMDRAANALEFVYYWRYWGWAGYRLGDRFAMFDPYVFLDRPRRAGRAWHWQPLLGRLVLNAAALSAERIGELADGLRRFRPRFLKGHASDLALLALLLEARGISDIHFKGVFPTAEMLLPPHREAMRRVFGGLVLDSYGHMERVVAVCQCERGGYHVNADYGLLQLEDVAPRGPEGQCLGRVVGTGLHNLAMPFLRYDVGDFIEPADDAAPCPCGRTLPLVRSIQGRREDVLVTPDGRVAAGLYNVLGRVPEIELGQLEQDGRDHVTVAVVPGPDYDARVEARLTDILTGLLGPAMRIEVRHVARDAIKRTPDGKVRTIIGYATVDEALRESGAL